MGEAIGADESHEIDSGIDLYLPGFLGTFRGRFVKRYGPLVGARSRVLRCPF